MDRIDYEVNRIVEKLDSVRSLYEKSILYDVNRFDVYDRKIEVSDSTVLPVYTFDITSIAVGATVAVLFDFHLTGFTGDNTVIALKASNGTFMFYSSCSTSPNSHYVGTSTDSRSALNFGARSSDNHYIAKLVITRLS